MSPSKQVTSSGL